MEKDAGIRLKMDLTPRQILILCFTIAEKLKVEPYNHELAVLLSELVLLKGNL